MSQFVCKTYKHVTIVHPFLKNVSTFIVIKLSQVNFVVYFLTLEDEIHQIPRCTSPLIIIILLIHVIYLKEVVEYSFIVSLTYHMIFYEVSVSGVSQQYCTKRSSYYMNLPRAVSIQHHINDDCIVFAITDYSACFVDWNPNGKLLLAVHSVLQAVY